MHARTWQFEIKPGKRDEFLAALDAVVHLVRREDGYCGVIALGSDGPDARGVRLVALWDSPEAVHASEKNMFLM